MANGTQPGGSALVASIAGVAIQVLPGILAMIRTAHAEADPTAPTPTDAEVIAGLERAVASSILKDDLWLAAHPSDEPILPGL